MILERGKVARFSVHMFRSCFCDRIHIFDLSRFSGKRGRKQEKILFRKLKIKNRDNIYRSLDTFNFALLPNVGPGSDSPNYATLVRLSCH